MAKRAPYYYCYDMKRFLTIAGALVSLVGIVWILQGIGLLPGSFMTGDRRWAVYGAVTAILGLVIIYINRRPRA